MDAKAGRRASVATALALSLLLPAARLEAHDIGAMRVKALFHADGRYDIDIVVDPEHLPPGMSPLQNLAERALGAPVRVASCYEAGRDGFWLHWVLQKAGIENRVIDPASLLVDRRARRAKTDRLDARTLARLLWSRSLRRVWMPDERCRVLRRTSRKLVAYVGL